jgi:type II restriction/modification system DNA methylase subunit YeeA
MTPSEFAAKWTRCQRTERAAAQEHFVDLCRMLDVETPNQADPGGSWYAFEKGAEKTGGGDGFADVWKRGHFAWEYKGKKKDLRAAYQQLLQYREALENPPLLIVCDLDRFEVHTNFTGTLKVVHAFTLDDLAKRPKEPLRVLRAAMKDPEALRPLMTRQQLTLKAAGSFAELAIALRARGNEAHAAAHFLNKILFCLFGEDADLLPKNVIKRIIDGAEKRPSSVRQALQALFGLMANDVAFKLFGPDPIQWFNGGLFDDDHVIEMTRDEITLLRNVAELDWSQIEPAIFGTLFERGLDPDKRSQLGAHYTDRGDIEKLVHPVVVAPLRGELAAMQARVRELLERGGKITKRTRDEENPEKVFEAFLDRLASVRILDPACGSGNFLYVALQAVKDLERETIIWGSEAFATPHVLPRVGPSVVAGIEINPYAAELARVTVWIGEIQWMLNNGYHYRTEPILQKLDHIECRDAILDRADPDRPRESQGPAAEFIVGNPPFLGGKLLRSVIGDAYVDDLFRVYDGRVPREADLVTYWFEKARALIVEKRTRRVGLIATQAIRGGANREVLKRIKESGDIFMAWDDEPWVVDGAAVHVSLIAYDDGSEPTRMLDGEPVTSIHADLTSGINLTRARRLVENVRIAFMGDTKGGKFDIGEDLALSILSQPNPHGRPNSDVVTRWFNTNLLTRQRKVKYIVDFGVGMREEDAALYEAPFEYVKDNVRPTRSGSRSRIREWWLHERPRVEMRIALRGLSRFIVTPTLSKHRIFAWLDARTLADHQLIVFARDDDYAFGVLHSRVHEVWSRAKGTQLREVESGFRYTPTSTFETFPFPRPSPAQAEAIAAAARRLNELREGWLNPPGASESDRKKRTLTNLYNERPTWLAHVHDALDAAVLAAYGWPESIGKAELLEKLLALNLERDAVDPSSEGYEVQEELEEYGDDEGGA